MELVARRGRELLEQLASGRRTVNLCLFAWLAAAAFRVTETPLAVLFFVGTAVAAVVGVLRIAKGLDLSGPKLALAVVASVIPLVGLLVMAWLGTRAAKVLRSEGYQVGMFVSGNRREA